MTVADATESLPRPPGPRHLARLPTWFGEQVVALVVIGLEVAIIVARERLGQDVGPVAVIVTSLALAAGGLMVRQRHPRLGCGIVAVAAVPLVTAPPEVGSLALAVALFALAAYDSPRTGWIGCAVVTAATVVVQLAKFGLGLTPEQLGSPVLQLLKSQGPLIPMALTYLVATLLGVNSGQRKRYIVALVEHASQLAHERDQQAQLAAAAERSRIAREIHDIVAHSLSVMVRLADGAETVFSSDPERAQLALTQIGRTGRSSLTEMRRVLDIMRDDQQPTGLDPTPTPAVDDLAQLIEVYRKAGLPVSWRAIGDPPHSAGVQLAVFRAVQEMLTNALRHAAPTRVDVEVDFRAGVVLTATNDKVITAPGGRRDVGRGLIGMQERAALYGGRVTSGPDGTTGWRVQMTLPEAGQDA